MHLLLLILIFAGIFAIFDALRKMNNNIMDQTKELKKIRDEWMKSNRK